MLLKSRRFFLSSLVLFSSLTFSALGDNDLRKAVIKDLKNQVEIKNGASLWRAASLNQMVVPGAQLRTGSASKVELLYPDGTITRLGSRTTLTILDKSARAVKVAKGKIWFKVAKKSVGYKIYSPTAMAAITGTEGFFDFDSKDNDKDSMLNSKLASNDKNFSIADNSGNGNTSFGLSEGTAQFSKGFDDNGEPLGESIEVREGQMVNFNGMGSFKIENVGSTYILKLYSNISTHNDNTEDNQNNNNNNQNNNNNNNQNNNNNNNQNNNNNNSNNNGVQNENLGPNNVTTDKQPNLPNNNQNLNTSPTTGDLEIIIK